MSRDFVNLAETLVAKSLPSVLYGANLSFHQIVNSCISTEFKMFSLMSLIFCLIVIILLHSTSLLRCYESKQLVLFYWTLRT